MPGQLNSQQLRVVDNSLETQSLEDELLQSLDEYKVQQLILSELQQVSRYVMDQITEEADDPDHDVVKDTSQYVVSNLHRILSLDQALVYVVDGARERLTIYAEETSNHPTDIEFTQENDAAVMAFQEGKPHLTLQQTKVLNHPLNTSGELAFPIRVKQQTYGSVKLIGTNVQHLESDIQDAVAGVIKKMSILFNSAHKDKVIEGQAIQLEDQAATIENVTHENHRLKALATRDELTGLENERAFNTAMHEKLREMLENTPDQTMSLVFFDLNKFKQINDNFGHDVGDEVLKTFSEALNECMREGSDHAYRKGGDEFLAKLHGGEESCQKIIKRVQAKYADKSRELLLKEEQKARKDFEYIIESFRTTGSTEIVELLNKENLGHNEIAVLEALETYLDHKAQKSIKSLKKRFLLLQDLSQNEMKLTIACGYTVFHNSTGKVNYTENNKMNIIKQLIDLIVKKADKEMYANKNSEQGKDIPIVDVGLAYKLRTGQLPGILSLENEHES